MDSGDERGYDGDSDSSDRELPSEMREWLDDIDSRPTPPGDFRVTNSACFYFLEAIDLHNHSLDCETRKERTVHALMRVALAATRAAYKLNEAGGEGLDKEQLRIGVEALNFEVRALEGMQKECLGEPCRTASSLPLLLDARGASPAPPMSPTLLASSPRPLKRQRTVPPVPLFDEGPVAYASRATHTAGSPNASSSSAQLARAPVNFAAPPSDIFATHTVPSSSSGSALLSSGAWATTLAAATRSSTDSTCTSLHAGSSSGSSRTASTSSRAGLPPASLRPSPTPSHLGVFRTPGFGKVPAGAPRPPRSSDWDIRIAAKPVVAKEKAVANANATAKEKEKRSVHLGGSGTTFFDYGTSFSRKDSRN